MDKPDEMIANAVAAATAAPERDLSFATRVEHLARRRRTSRMLGRWAVTTLVLLLSATLATMAFDLVRSALTPFDGSPLTTIMLTALGGFVALLFREMAQFALDHQT